MPFVSEKQRRYLWMHKPKLARKWTDKYGSRVKKHNSVISGIRFVKEYMKTLRFK